MYALTEKYLTQLQTSKLTTKELKMEMSKMMQMLKDKKQSLKKSEKTVKLAAGDNRVRILPGWRSIDQKTGTVDADGDPTFFHEFGQHYIKDAAGQMQAVYLCTNATFDKPCEVCSALSAASRHVTNDEDQKVLEEARANRVTLVNALLLDSTSPNTPVILELKYSIFSKVIGIMEEWEASPLDPENGQIFVMSRNGTGILTKYDVSLSPKKHRIAPEVLMKVVNLDEYVKQESAEQQRKAVSAVNALVGIGFAPAARSDSPTSVALPAPAAAAFSDVPDFPATPVAAAKSAAVTLDSDLDDLLSEL